MVSRSVRRSVGWLVGRSLSHLVGRSVGWSVDMSFSGSFSGSVGIGQSGSENRLVSWTFRQSVCLGWSVGIGRVVEHSIAR